MRGVVSVVVLALLTSGCVGHTTPEDSEQLARAFRAQMLDVPLPDANNPLEHRESEANVYYVETAVYQTRFAGVQRWVGLDRELNEVVRSWWGENREPDLDPGLPLSVQREPWARFQLDRAARFRTYARVLRARIASDPEDTAARGLMAVAVLALWNGEYLMVSGYPHYCLLTESVLELPPPDVPDCVLYSEAPDASEDLMACRVPQEERLILRGLAGDQALTWIDEIAAVDPNSTWIEIARLMAVSRGETGGLAHEDFQLAASSSTVSPRMAVQVALRQDVLAVDGLEVLRLEDGRFPEEAWRVDLLEPLYERLLEKAADARLIQELTGRRFERRIIVQADRRHR
jgi:hypothetical protein